MCCVYFSIKNLTETTCKFSLCLCIKLHCVAEFDLEKLRDEDSKKGVNESITPWFRRRFSHDELDYLIKDIKDQIEEGESLDTAIYDTVRQFIASKQFNDINDEGTEQEYWDSYLIYEKPLVKFVKENIINN